MVGIILLAMVAAFLALRLYSVLGKRTGHEQPLIQPGEERPAVPGPRALEDAAPAGSPVSDSVFEPAAAQGIRAMVASDHAFDVARFLEGAKAAYRMILEAYWRDDEAALEGLVSDDVKSAFGEAIARRKAAGQTLDNRLVHIDRAVISQASLAEGQAEITVRFDADIAAVTRDAQGDVIAGSLTDAVPTHDAWTFARDTRSRDPNWILTDTDEAA